MIIKCMFPAAGLGTRFLPATKALPKEMLPIVDTPLIQYAVSEAETAGMLEIAIVTGKNKKAIEDHFDVNLEVEQNIAGSSKEKLLAPLRRLMKRCRFSYTRQAEAKGLGHAILVGETLVGNQPFGVILADDLCISNESGVMSQMVEIYNKYKCSVVAIEEVPPQDVDKYGVISGEEIDPGVFRIDNMVEKPDVGTAPSNYAIIGRYILTPDIFEIIRNLEPGKNGEIQITDALLEQAKQGNVVGYIFKGRRFDCGSISGFMEANNYFFAERK